MTFAGEYLCQIFNDFTKRSEKPISIEPPHWEICQKACTGKTLSMDCVSSGRIRLNFELIQALIHVPISCKYEKDPIKNSGENVMTKYSI